MSSASLLLPDSTAWQSALNDISIPPFRCQNIVGINITNNNTLFLSHTPSSGASSDENGGKYISTPFFPTALIYHIKIYKIYFKYIKVDNKNVLLYGFGITDWVKYPVLSIKQNLGALPQLASGP
jgi:hypothetical protein